jgi:hypothetical protein
MLQSLMGSVGVLFYVGCHRVTFARVDDRVGGSRVQAQRGLDRG